MASPAVTPWRPRVSCRRVDVEAWVALRRAGRALLSPLQASEPLEAIVGAKVEWSLRQARRGKVPEPLEGGLAMELAGVDGEATGVTLEVETALAVTLTARALKRPAPKLTAVLGDDDAATLAGGLAAIVTAASRSHEGTGPLRVRAAGPSAALFAARRGEEPEVDVATFRVTVDDGAYVARVLVRAAAARPGVERWGRKALALLGDLPLDLPIVASTCLATASDLAALEVGDAWMLGPAAWTRTLCGDVILVAPGAESGARAALVEDGVLVLRALAQELRHDPMPGEGDNDPIIEALGDVPIVVRVEVGAARMTAREWAEVGVGDVIGLAHKLAEPVTLRVAGAEVAKGELVDIEGEVGVRILSRPSAGQGSGRGP